MGEWVLALLVVGILAADLVANPEGSVMKALWRRLRRIRATKSSAAKFSILGFAAWWLVTTPAGAPAGYVRLHGPEDGRAFAELRGAGGARVGTVRARGKTGGWELILYGDLPAGTVDREGCFTPAEAQPRSVGGGGNPGLQ